MHLRSIEKVFRFRVVTTSPSIIWVVAKISTLTGVDNLRASTLPLIGGGHGNFLLRWCLWPYFPGTANNAVERRGRGFSR